MLAVTMQHCEKKTIFATHINLRSQLLDAIWPSNHITVSFCMRGWILRDPYRKKVNTKRIYLQKSSSIQPRTSPPTLSSHISTSLRFQNQNNIFKSLLMAWTIFHRIGWLLLPRPAPAFHISKSYELQPDFRHFVLHDHPKFSLAGQRTDSSWKKLTQHTTLQINLDIQNSDSNFVLSER